MSKASKVLMAEAGQVYRSNGSSLTATHRAAQGRGFQFGALEEGLRDSVTSSGLMPNMAILNS